MVVLVLVLEHPERQVVVVERVLLVAMVLHLHLEVLAVMVQHRPFRALL